MEQWVYLKCTTTPNDLVYIIRKKGGLIEDWNSRIRKWNKNNDAIAAFIGLDDEHYENITEEKVNRIIDNYK